MRSPGPTFDLRAALIAELRACAADLEVAPGDARALHHCRVALKRARALARVGAIAAPGLAAVFDESARVSMRALAPARAQHALAEAARAAAKEARGKKTAAALTAAAEALDAESAVAPEPHFASVAACVRDLLALAQVWPDSSARQIKRGARRVIRRARRARRRGCCAQQRGKRHAWRKREKDRLYAATLLGEAWPGRKRRHSSGALTELLGQERDAELLLERLCASPTNSKRAIKALRRRRDALRAKADAMGARLRKARV